MKLYKETGTNPFARACRSCCSRRSSSPCSACSTASRRANAASACIDRRSTVDAGRAARRSSARRCPTRSCDADRRCHRQDRHGRPDRPDVGDDVHHPAPADMQEHAGSALDNPFAKQQKMLLYVLPLFFAVSGINFPIGVLHLLADHQPVVDGPAVLRDPQQPATRHAGVRRPGKRRKAAKARRKHGLPPEPAEPGPLVVAGSGAPAAEAAAASAQRKRDRRQRRDRRGHDGRIRSTGRPSRRRRDGRLRARRRASSDPDTPEWRRRHHAVDRRARAHPADQAAEVPAPQVGAPCPVKPTGDASGRRRSKDQQSSQTTGASRPGARPPANDTEPAGGRRRRRRAGGANGGRRARAGGRHRGGLPRGAARHRRPRRRHRHGRRGRPRGGLASSAATSADLVGDRRRGARRPAGADPAGGAARDRRAQPADAGHRRPPRRAAAPSSTAAGDRGGRRTPSQPASRSSCAR